MHEVQKLTDELQKEAFVFVSLCSGRLQGRRHTLSDNLPEDLQKFSMVSAYVSCSVPFCCQRSAINNHPFCWNKICNSVGIASVEFDESELKPLCIKHYGLVYQFVNAIQIHKELCQYVV